MPKRSGFGAIDRFPDFQREAKNGTAAFAVSAVRVPPCASMIVFPMAKPSPKPFGLVELNASKIGVPPDGNPGPLSATVTATISPRLSADTFTQGSPEDLA